MPSEKGTVHIIDDDDALRESLAFLLRTARIDVASYSSAAAFLEEIPGGKLSCVITDLRMSGMDGMALFENIHKSNPTLPVIILTAHGTIPDAVAATQRGVFGYLTKPFDSKELLQQVEKAVSVSGGRTEKETRTNRAADRDHGHLPGRQLMVEALFVSLFLDVIGGGWREGHEARYQNRIADERLKAFGQGPIHAKSCAHCW